MAGCLYTIGYERAYGSTIFTGTYQWNGWVVCKLYVIQIRGLNPPGNSILLGLTETDNLETVDVVGSDGISINFAASTFHRMNGYSVSHSCGTVRISHPQTNTSVANTPDTRSATEVSGLTRPLELATNMGCRVRVM